MALTRLPPARRGSGEEAAESRWIRWGEHWSRRVGGWLTRGGEEGVVALEKGRLRRLTRFHPARTIMGPLMMYVLNIVSG